MEEAEQVQQLEASAEDVKIATSVLKHERLQWPLEEEERNALHGPVKRAILYGGVAEVKKLLESASLGSDFYLQSDDGIDLGIGTVLDLVMLNKRYKLALDLLLQNEDAQELAKNSTRALAWAAREGQTEILDTLLELNADIMQVDEKGRSALFLAAMRGKQPCVRLLLDKGAFEVEEKQQEVQQWMEHWKIQPDGSVKPSLKSQDKVVSSEKVQTTTSRWQNAPHERLQWTVQSSSEVHKLRYQLERAILAGGVATEIDQLIANGAPLDGEYHIDAQKDDVGNALDLAVFARRYKLALHLLVRSEGAALVQSSTRALAWAAHEGQVMIVKNMLQLGALVTQPNKGGQSPLLLAAMRGQRQCFEHLVSAGAWQCEASPVEVREFAEQFKLTSFLEVR